MNSFFKKIIRWLFALPNKEVLQDIRIYQGVIFIAYLAFLLHFSWIFVFFKLKIPVLFYYNIASSLFWLFSIWLSRFKGKVVTSILSGAIEIIIHQVLAIHILGWGYGFQYYFFPIVAYIYIAYTKRTKIPAIITASILLLYVTIYYCIPNIFPPEVILSAAVENAFNVVNIFSAFLFVGISCYTFSSTVRRMEEKNTYFVKVFAHDIKNRLAAGIPILEMCALDPRKDDIREAVENEKEMNRMVLNIINIFSNEAIILRKQKVDIVLLTKKITEHWEKTFQSKGIEFSCSFKNIEFILIDYDYMQLVWDNLLSNAFAHTPEGGRVEVRFTQEGDFAQAAFLNSGSLVPQDRRGALFTQYLSPEKQTLYNKGLGLNYSKMMCRLHGGDISYTDENDMNKFIVALPSITSGRFPGTHS